MGRVEAAILRHHCMSIKRKVRSDTVKSYLRAACRSIGVATIVMVLTTSCRSDPIEPSRPSSGLTLSVASELPSSDSLFYWFRSSKVALEPSDSIVIRSAEGTPPGAVAGARAMGIVGARLSQLSGRPGYWIAGLTHASGGPEELAASVAAALRADTAAFRFVEPVSRVLGTGSIYIPLDQVNIGFRRSATTTQVADLLEGLGLELIRGPIPDSGYYDYRARITPRAKFRPLALASELGSHSLAEYASLDNISPIRNDWIPTDPYYGQQWYMRNGVNTLYGVPVDINAQGAWDITRGSSAVKVGLVGEGVDATHQELAAAFGGAMTFDLIPPLPGYPYSSPSQPAGNDFHDTAVAGIIFGAHNNNMGMAGVAPDSRICVARIFQGVDLPADTTRWASPGQIYDGISWAWQSCGASVISLTWFRAPDATIDAAVTNAATLGRGGKGTVVVGTSGNAGSGSPLTPINFPGNNPNAMSVGAVTRTGVRASYSKYGPGLDLVAPSGSFVGPVCANDAQTGVFTTDRWGPTVCNWTAALPNDGYLYLSGTSFSAPQVAGVAALLLAAQPNLTAAQVRARFCLAARPWGPANEFGCGKLDALRTLSPPLSVSIANPIKVKPNVQCLWTATVSGGTQPYSFAWEVGGVAVGSTNPLQYTNSGSSFSLRVVVTDAQGIGIGDATKSVQVLASAAVCLS